MFGKRDNLKMLRKSGRKQKLYDEGVHKSIKNCWEVFRHLATPADSLAIMVQKTGYFLHMFFIALKRNKTYPENSFFTLGNTASLRNALLTIVFSSIQNICRASIIKRRASSYLFLIQRY